MLKASSSQQGRQLGFLSSQRGLSLVELLVGIAVGLFVVAGATALVGGQLGDTRRLVTETQMMQDLRATADVVVREIRRASYSVTGHHYVWGESAASVKNGMSPATPSSSEASETVFYYDRTLDQTGPWGFKLNNGVVQVQLGTGGWQDLTDTRVMNVTSFSVTPRTVATLQIPCSKDCADGTTACWPTVAVREFDVSITAVSRTDSSVVRTVSSTARLRNDQVNYNITGSPTQLCPA